MIAGSKSYRRISMLIKTIRDMPTIKYYFRWYWLSIINEIEKIHPQYSRIVDYVMGKALIHICVFSAVY